MCTAADHAALKLDPAAFRAATLPIDGVLADLVDDEGPEAVRLELYCGANCVSCGSTLFLLSAVVWA